LWIIMTQSVQITVFSTTTAATTINIVTIFMII